MSASFGRHFALAGCEGDGFRPYLNKSGAFHGAKLAQSEKDETGFWRPRPQAELEAIFSEGYGFPVDLSLQMHGLETVAKALNDDHACLAAIALVQMRIPSLPDPSAAQRMARADALAKAGMGYLAQPRVPAGQPGAGQWMAEVGEAAAMLAERGLPWLLRASARLAGPVAIAAGILFPDNASLESNGAVPGFPGLSYRFSEGRLTLIQADGQGGAKPLFSSLPYKDGFYRSRNGIVVGRAVGDSFMIDNDGASRLISANTAQNGGSDEGGEGASSPGIGHNGGPAMEGMDGRQAQNPNQRDPDQDRGPANVAPTPSSGSDKGDLAPRNSLSTSDILFPNGRPVGERIAGSARRTRTVTTQEFDQLTSQLLTDAVPVEAKSGYEGEWYQRGDGTVFGLRDSREHGPTIDIIRSSDPNLSRFKAHRQ